jgi:formate dehydrogenase iron-sulfur subunit
MEDLNQQAKNRLEELQKSGITDATIYAADNSSVEGTHAMFIVRGDPRTYNLPSSPEVPTVYLKKAWTASAIASGLLLAATLMAFISDGTRKSRRY